MGFFVCVWFCTHFRIIYSVVVVQLLSHVWLFATPWTATCQTSLSFTISRSFLKFMSIALVISSSYLILWRPLLLLHSILLNIRDFSNESVLCIRWPKYWSFSFSISPSNKYSRLISLKTDWFDPFSNCLQSCLASGSFPMSQFFTSGGQSNGASVSASVLPMNIQDWFSFRIDSFYLLLSKGLLRVFSSTTVKKHQFFSTPRLARWHMWQRSICWVRTPWIITLSLPHRYLRQPIR